MSRKHALIVAAALGLAAVFGAVAAIQTASAGKPDASAVSDATVAQRVEQLDAFEASLRKQLASRPAALPAVPAPATAAGAAAPEEKVVYVRPAPRVVTVPRAGDDDEHEHADDHDHEDEHDGGEADD